MDRSYVEDSEDAGEASDTSTDSDAPPEKIQSCKTRGHGQASKVGAEEGGASSNIQDRLRPVSPQPQDLSQARIRLLASGAMEWNR